MISFVIPGKPQGKGRPRVGRVGGHARMFTPAATVAYEGLIALAAQTAMGDAVLLDGPVGCNVFIDAPLPSSWSLTKRAAAIEGRVMPTTKPDCDNVVKAVFDGLNGVLWRDDVQVVDLRVRKRYALTPCVRVEVWELDSSADLERSIQARADAFLSWKPQTLARLAAELTEQRLADLAKPRERIA